MDSNIIIRRAKIDDIDIMVGECDKKVVGMCTCNY